MRRSFEPGIRKKGERMAMRVRRTMLLGLIGPLVLTPLVVFGYQGRDWWRHVSVIIGGGYLIPVLGTLAGWRLTELARKAGQSVVFPVRALVGMALTCGLSFLLLVTSSSSLNAAWARLSAFLRFEVLAALIVIGLLYALPCIRWGR